MKSLLAVVVAALAAPASAFAAGPMLNAQEVPLHAARATAGAVPRFNMVGLHWRGSGSVSFSTRSAAGGWSSWRKADDDQHVEHSWHLGNLVWTRAANAIRFRVGGSLTRLRAYYVWSPTERGLLRRTQIVGEPPIILRLSWGADESIRRAAPRYADAVHFAIVHHTAGSNNYSAAQSAAIVRGIQIYHV
jgi:hypothetical protein